MNDLVPLRVGTVPVNISAVLSAGVFTRDPPVPSLDGKGTVRLYNSSTSRTLFLVQQETAPDSSQPPVRIPPLSWHPQDIYIDLDSPVWIWSSAANTPLRFLIIGWS